MSAPELVVLPPFTAKAKCRKCGAASGIATCYQKDVHHSADCTVPRDAIPPEDPARITITRPCCSFEHMERTCGRCGYQWAEAVLS